MARDGTGVERGAASIVVLGVLVLGILLCFSAARAGAGAVAAARADAAADAAALAAADMVALGRGASAARQAAAVTAAANGAQLTRCACSGTVLTAVVEVDVPVLGAVAHARARAEVLGSGVEHLEE